MSLKRGLVLFKFHRIQNLNQEETSKERKSKRKYVKRTWSRCSLSSSDISGLWHQHRKPKRCKLNVEKNLNVKSKSFVATQAEELRSKLDPRYPSFAKSLVKSHVTGGFRMGLPAPFCQKHLPSKDTIITLETQHKKLYKTKYLVRKTGLSGGWKGFAISERLLVGDVLVFQLIADAKFKSDNFTRGARKCIDSPQVDQRSMQPPEYSESNSTENSFRSRVADGFPICEEAALSPSAVSTFDNFSIVINDLLKDYELPRHIKWSYYKLCCSQDSLLHANLPHWMNHILIGGVIIETVTIADALRQCDLSTSKEEFAIWDKTLSALELLGMNNGFLRSHLHHLQRIVHDPEVATFKQRCLELCSENSRAEDEIRSLTARLAELKKVHKKRAADIDNLKSKINNHELKFQEQVHAPW
ncbi:B3 domain-containing protein Os01g0234100-like [Chenopodium quinoa]|uniref:B3 domain-containing protein Os01g0234100-like n=1 Tax=Chenopodium quinoa TaxID=63459 RepID=UPI000B783235|nr:B3 domain-containing protein Os01g0234100-like [Chenopodium quinoa]